jgi:hypothetical protein
MDARQSDVPSSLLQLGDRNRTGLPGRVPDLHKSGINTVIENRYLNRKTVFIYRNRGQKQCGIPRMFQSIWITEHSSHDVLFTHYHFRKLCHLLILYLVDLTLKMAAPKLNCFMRASRSGAWALSSISLEAWDVLSLLLRLIVVV